MNTEIFLLGIREFQQAKSLYSEQSKLFQKLRKKCYPPETPQEHLTLEEIKKVYSEQAREFQRATARYHKLVSKFQEENGGEATDLSTHSSEAALSLRGLDVEKLAEEKKLEKLQTLLQNPEMRTIYEAAISYKSQKETATKLPRDSSVQVQKECYHDVYVSSCSVCNGSVEEELIVPEEE